ncbi:NEL-type E3 ubiquitin ligase domain-containing protein [Pseudomonas sp. TMB3-21]
MSEVQGSNSTDISSEPTIDKSIHEHRVISVIPDAVKSASPALLEPVLKLNATTPDWYSKASVGDKQNLKVLIDDHWRLQGEMNTALLDLQSDIDVFAKPSLAASLKENFNIVEDSETLSLKLYVPDTIIFGLDTGANHMRHSSLLAAALHNFEEPETEADAFRSGSGVFRNDAQGNPLRIDEITPQRFAGICRELDIGKQYQTHIKAQLQSQDPAAQRALQACSIASEKAAFRMAALIARLKGDVSASGYDCLREVVEGKSELTLSGRPLLNHRLSLMGFKMSGIVLFSAVSEPSEVKKAIEALTPQGLKFWLDWSRRLPFLPGDKYSQFKFLQNFFANGPQGVVEDMLRKDDIYQQTRLSGSLIAYIPDDPDQPLKEYASLADFMKILLSQLRTPQYQEFFSRFVEQKDKGRFFSRVNERLKTVTWQQREPLDMGPWWRETAIENPNAEPITNILEGDLWRTLFLLRRGKAIADARRIAVPTGDEDAATRWKRLTSVLEIGWNIFNFGAMLVPGLGEAMLGIMVGQMLAELAEGVEDWSNGDKEQASAYFTGVLINFAQLALMGAGHVLPEKVVPIKPSPFVEQLKPVQINGEERLWNPDLKAYEHATVLPETAQANRLGIYQHEGRDVLPLDDKHYAVSHDIESGQHRLQHPTRPGAYQPVVEHNGAGAWKTEVDQPLTWDKARLAQRFNACAEPWPAETQEQIHTVAGVSEDVLRRLHVELERPPVMLADTAKRFRLYAQAGEVSEQILAGQPPETLMDEITSLMTDLPRWPQNRAVEIFEGAELSGDSTVIGNIDAAPADRITLTRSEFCAGELPRRTLEILSEKEIHDLLGQAISTDKNVRIQALKERVASDAVKQRKRLFESLYNQQEASAGTPHHRLANAYPDLPDAVVQQLMADATPADLQHLEQKPSLPLRFHEQARKAKQQVRVSRAYEGLYLDGLENNDTRRLELASLANLPGWSNDVRIEIRAFSFTGELKASVGPENAPIRKVLVLEDEGSYQARDESNQHLHGSDDFYASLLRALPDDERKALGYDIYESERLKLDLQRSPLERERFEAILDEHPDRKPAYDPDKMRLRGGMQGYRQLVDEPMLRQRVRALYPAFSDEEVSSLISGFGDEAHARVAALQTEFNELNRSLQRWMNSPTISFRFSPAGVAEWQSRDRLYRLIRQCWQRTGPAGVDAPGIIGAQSLILDGLPMSRHLASFPKLAANFDHVTSLSIRDGNLLSSQVQFLEPFRNLRSLDLGHNLLTGVPPIIGNLPHLNELMLGYNHIVLTPQAVTRLRGLTRMRAMGLQRNPLGLVPDISQMPELQLINLEQTGINRWPPGLFSQSRSRHISVILRDNRLTEIPEVAPGSFRAELLARTIVSREAEWMPADVLEQLRLYTESVGLDPDRSYPPLGLVDSLNWGEGMSEELLKEKIPIWDSLEDEFNSEAFFNEIRMLTQSADFMASDVSYRAALTAKVWRMLEAMSENAELREQLFAEAVVPSECGDGGVQLFNALGVKVLVHEAYALQNPALVEAQLVELARGKSRLNELGAIARSRVSDRIAQGETFRRVAANGDVTGNIDEVEVHLAYMTELAERLDLPWQARGMLFRNMARVTHEMIDAAEARVLALEAGDLLVDRILEQPFWQTYLENAYRQEFNDLALRMEGEDEMAQFTAIKALEKTLTKQAIERAKLQRTEVPFAVQSAG